MDLKKGTNIRRHFITFLAGVVIITLVFTGLIYYLDKQATKHYEDRTYEQMDFQVNLVKKAVENKISTLESVNEQLAGYSLKEYFEEKKAPQSIENLFRESISLFSDIEAIIFEDFEKNKQFSTYADERIEIVIDSLSDQYLTYYRNTSPAITESVVPPLYINNEIQLIAVYTPVYLKEIKKGDLLIFISLKTTIDQYITQMKIGKDSNSNLYDKTGNVIFDQMTEIVGRNIFDGLYKDNQTRLNLNNRLITEVSGKDVYTSPDKKNNSAVRKLICWYSADFFNQRFIISLSVPDTDIYRNVEKQRLFFLIAGALIFVFFAILSALNFKRKIDKNIEDEEHRYRQLFDDFQDGLVIVDQKIIRINQAFQNITGYSSQEIVGKSIVDFCPPFQKDSGNSAEFLNKQLQILTNNNRVTFPWQILRKDSTQVSTEASVNRAANGDKNYYHFSFRDVTEKLKSEEKLIQSEKKYKLLAENASDVIWLTDKNLNFTYASPSVKPLTDFTPEEFMAIPFSQHFTPESLQKANEIIQRRLKLESKSATNYTTRLEVEAYKKDGSLLWVEVLSSPLHDEKGNLSGFSGITRDISERKMSEKLLLKEKEQLSAVLRSISEGVIAFDRERKIILINKASEEITGFLLMHVINLTIDSVFILKDNKEIFYEITDRILNHSLPGHNEREAKILTQDGVEKQVKYSMNPITGNDQEISGIVLTFRDISEQNRMEGELQKAQRIESIGLLAGGIAHDFNNLLVAILGNISLAKYNTARNENNFPLLEEAEKATLKAKDLTQQLLSFAKGGEPVKEVSGINSLLRSLVSTVNEDKRYFCELVSQSDYLVEIDKIRIKQALQNVVMNSRQSMPNGGELAIKTQLVDMQKGNLLNIPEGEYVKISIIDHGIGINKENITKIFDPYFTTKPKGSGLGLFIVYSIIKKHNGFVDVESEMGKGTAFHVFLPAVEQTEIIENEDDLVKGRGKILVMDDEDFVRSVVRRMLMKLGYEFEFSEDGQEAIEKYTEAMNNNERFDAVILDLTIPAGIGGKDVIERLLFIDPEVKAIVSSGFSSDEVIANYSKYGFKGVIRKPYKVVELGQILYKVIKDR